MSLSLKRHLPWDYRHRDSSDTSPHWSDQSIWNRKQRSWRMNTYKLMEPRWIGIKGALATRSPSGANSAQEKSRRSLMLVLIEVCCKERPIASATLMKRLAKRVSRIGSGPLLGVFVFRFSIDIIYAWSNPVFVPKFSGWGFKHCGASMLKL